jgi:hypothetical protein
VAQAFEALMLVCFGLAWRINALPMLRSGQPQGKGLCFTLIVWRGYVSGMVAKLLWTVGAGAALPPVFWLHVLNTVTVGFNLWLYARYRQRARSGRGGTFEPAA